MKTDQGETDLKKMLGNLQPILSEELFVYCFLAHPGSPDFPVWASISEQEGLTLIMTQDEADRQGFSFACLWKRITLSVHSSLEAVGLTAHVSKVLAEAGISANMVAGYYHDHVFVQAESAPLAYALLDPLVLGKSLISLVSEETSL